ncbi:unnamed protein product [Prorocentrum cordatum]|uniref:Uncharacterized protein n=1 Tax=Prorocentrum cordatum TaxID=2364126 RepID=A0ABN9SUD2_9DINO|nr:unnamed protein product [Polarella glacialis]
MVATSRLAHGRASLAPPNPPTQQPSRDAPCTEPESRSASRMRTAALVGWWGPAVPEDTDEGLAAPRRGVRPAAEPPQGAAQHDSPRAPRVHAVPMAVAPPPSAEEFAAMMEADIHDLFDLPAMPALAPPLLQSQWPSRGLWADIQSMSASGSVASAGQ